MKFKESSEPIEKLRKMSAEERRRYLDRRLKELVVYACEKSPATAARLHKAGISPTEVNGIGDLASLPVLRKDDLIDLYRADPPFGGLSTLQPQELERIYVSPGPIYDPYHKSETFWRWMTQLMREIGFGTGDIVLNAWSYHMVPAGLMVDEALRRAGATVIPTGVGNTELQVQVMKQLQATGFFGAASFFMNIVSKAEEMGYDIVKDFNLRLACIGGEMGGGPIRKLVEEKYGITTRDVYGTGDVGLMAYECAERKGLHIVEDVIVEIINPATGEHVQQDETGELVITAIDESYPLLRFGTGDLVGWISEHCPCGRSSLRITHILGRTGEAVRTRGMLIHPRQLQRALEQFHGICRYQAIVTREGYRDYITLKIELHDDNISERETLSGQIARQVTEAIRIKLDKVEPVPPGTIAEDCKIISDERQY